MTSLPLGVGAWDRPYGKMPQVKLTNRFFEENPTNQVNGVALLSRPGTSHMLAVGSGPLRRLFYQIGAFDNNLFIVSGDTLYRWDGESAPVSIGSGLSPDSLPQMAVMSGYQTSSGSAFSYQYLFIADGLNLYYYAGISSAEGELAVAGTISSGDSIEINGTYYRWTSGSVNSGTPSGTSGSPFLVALGSSNEEALDNMAKALNFLGESGVTYSSTLGGANVDVQAVASDATTLTVRARDPGIDGNSITTTASGSGISWTSGSTLAGGGVEGLTQVLTPDDTSVKDVVSLGGHIIVVESNSNRFFWILPGETTIDPLHFSSAEQSPDAIENAVVVGSNVWFVGQNSIEAWYVTGDPDQALLPNSGLVFAQGALPGTVVRIKDYAVLVGQDGVVYSVGGGLRRLSNNGIEEQIRLMREELEASLA